MSALEAGRQRQGAEEAVPLRRNRDFWLLMGGQYISGGGSQVSQFAFPLLVLAVTGSAGWAGLAAALVGAPYFFLCLPAGAWLDRWDRKRTMILCDIGRALCLGSIPLADLLGRLTLFQLCICALLEGCLFTFFDIALSSGVPRLVAPSQVGRATAIESQMRQTSFMLGPALGGILFGIGRTLPALFDALSYLISIVSLASIKGAFQMERAEVKESLGSQVREGLAWLWRHRLIRFFAGLSAVGNSFDNSLWLLFLVLAVHMHAPSWSIGTAFGLAGISGFLAPMAVLLLQRFPLRRLLLITQWSIVSLIPALLIVPNVFLLCVLVGVLIFASALQATYLYSYRQRIVPDQVMARATSVFRLIAYAGAPLALWVTGLLLQFAGSVVTVLTLFALLLLVAVLVTVNTQVRLVERGGEAAGNEVGAPDLGRGQ